VELRGGDPRDQAVVAASVATGSVIAAMVAAAGSR
jgi:hypothetical protein